MKKILLLILAINILGCTNYPKEPPYLVGKDHFVLQEVEKAAPYKYKNQVQTENEYNIHNLPPKIGSSRKNWEMIVEKYKADLFYDINKRGSDIYIERRIRRWHQEEELTKPEQFYDLLKKEGYTNYKVIDTASMVFHSPYLKMPIILLEYEGVKHEVKLIRKEISIQSYPKSQQDYWESQGNFMLDTPNEVMVKWHKENK